MTYRMDEIHASYDNLMLKLNSAVRSYLEYKIATFYSMISSLVYCCIY